MAATLGGQGKAQGTEGQPEKRKKESILDLTKFLEKPVRVKFAGKTFFAGFCKTKKYGNRPRIAYQNLEEPVAQSFSPFSAGDGRQVHRPSWIWATNLSPIS
jgi:hypothetical protein